MKLIVGLGNPGMTYHRTRHNVGFMVIDRLGRKHGVSLNQRQVNARDGRPAGVYGEYSLDREPVRLMMPLTMMNESGYALEGIGLAPRDLLIVCDDVNLPLGALRLRPQGSSGGHNGLSSCLGALGTEDVPRLRIGVGTPDMPTDLKSFVLGNFPASERTVIDEALEQAAEACELWVKEGIELAMNRCNKVQE